MDSGAGIWKFKKTGDDGLAMTARNLTCRRTFRELIIVVDHQMIPARTDIKGKGGGGWGRYMLLFF
jgi:hypothetical protein